MSATRADARPSATLCILTYNQERYVEAAIAGALGQDHPGLEIIISDDGSSDQTWQRVCDATRAYQGPHAIVLRQSEANRGILRHVLDVADVASGKLLILNAGDDISVPERCRVLCDAWFAAPFAAAFSDYAMIDDTGRITRPHYHFDDSLFSPGDYLPGTTASSIHGASSVYETDVLQAIGRSAGEHRAAFEDTWLSLVIASLGLPIRHLPRVLVWYRQHADAVTNFERTDTLDAASIRKADRHWQSRSGGYAATLAAFRAWYDRRPDMQRPLSAKLAKDVECFERFGRWSQLSIFERLGTLRYASRFWMLRTAVIRTLPMPVRLLLRR